MREDTRLLLRSVLSALIIAIGAAAIAFVLTACTVVYIKGDGNTITDTGGPSLTPTGRTPLKDLLHPGGGGGH